jgi:UDP-glucose 4-epimerase
MKKILITGGTGFIGKNLLESFLKDDYDLVAPKRAELDCSNDQSVKEYFANRSFDVVIHSAAKPGHRNASDTSNLLYTNARMIHNLLRHSHQWGKLLNMGSGAIYCMNNYQPKMNEDYFGTHMPADEHGFNKYMFGKLLPHLDSVYDFRIFGIFGKYEDYSIRFISNAICKAICDLPITLRQNRKFDYLYVNDLAPVIKHFIEHQAREKAFNITPDQPVELLYLANLIKKISGKDIDVKISQPGMGLEYSGDNSRLRAEMKDLKFTPIEKAVEDLYAWYYQNRASINKDSLLNDK